MIIRPSTVREDPQAIPLLFKEGLGVVDRDAPASAHRPLPLPPAAEGNHFQSKNKARARPANGGKRREMRKRC
jgi:hypothetical protein